MRILLVQPQQKGPIGLHQMGEVEPLGLEMVAASIPPPHQVEILDLRFVPEMLDSALSKLQPDLVGISSTFTVDIYQTFQAAERAKAICPRSFVIIGGHHASLYPSDFEHAAIDAIVAGEGETTVPELLGCLERGEDPEGVPGLLLNRPGGQLRTEQRPLIENLDQLPFPRRELTRNRGWEYSTVLTGAIGSLETSRGCPYKCNFCSVWRFYQGKMRFKSPARVLAELETVREPTVSFTDDNFFASISRASEIARLVEARGIGKRYLMQLRTDDVAEHPELVAHWKRLGLMAAFFGFEKPTEEGLVSVNKHNSVENNERGLEILRSQGIEPVVTFIVDPDWDRSDFAALSAYVSKLKLRQPGFAVLTPLPGTSLFDELKNQVTTKNYELWDLAHAVLPTRLPIHDFYGELAELWRQSYPRWKLLIGQAYLTFQEMRAGRGEGARLRRVLTQVRRLQKPKAYLQ